MQPQWFSASKKYKYMNNTLSSSSRVWIYQANPAFAEKDLSELQAILNQFAAQWVSHSRQLQAVAEVRYGRFIVLMVDESQAGASGCSIDSSVRFMKQLEQKYKVDLFDRMIFAYQQKGKVLTADRDTFAKLYQQNVIDDNTLVFDNLVNTKADLEQKWLKPLHESWHMRMV